MRASRGLCKQQCFEHQVSLEMGLSGSQIRLRPPPFARVSKAPRTTQTQNDRFPLLEKFYKISTKPKCNHAQTFVHPRWSPRQVQAFAHYPPGVSPKERPITTRVLYTCVQAEVVQATMFRALGKSGNGIVWFSNPASPLTFCKGLQGPQGHPDPTNDRFPLPTKF